MSQSRKVLFTSWNSQLIEPNIPSLIRLMSLVIHNLISLSTPAAHTSSQYFLMFTFPENMSVFCIFLPTHSPQHLFYRWTNIIRNVRLKIHFNRILPTSSSWCLFVLYYLSQIFSEEIVLCLSPVIDAALILMSLNQCCSSMQRNL